MNGTPGRRTSEHLIQGEAFRRIMAGEAPEKLDEFAQQLLQWFQQAYPAASPLTRHIIDEQIRDTWHRRHDMIRGG